MIHPKKPLSQNKLYNLDVYKHAMIMYNSVQVCASRYLPVVQDSPLVQSVVADGV